MVHCRNLIEMLSEYLEQELDENMVKEIERHLKICPPCKIFYNTFKKTLEMKKSIKVKDIPEDCRAALREMLVSKLKAKQ